MGVQLSDWRVTKHQLTNLLFVSISKSNPYLPSPLFLYSPQAQEELSQGPGFLGNFRWNFAPKIFWTKYLPLFILKRKYNRFLKFVHAFNLA